MTTAYHAKYFAHALTREGGEGVDRLARSLFDACVDLNPHQIESAIFAMRSPLVKGVLLADEVGLGKTIEAGLVLCQNWAERRRRLLIVCPASIRKQWALELEEKFHVPSIVLDAKTYREAQKDGTPGPFETDRVVVCSMHFASSRASEIRAIPWDLVVIDEAHKLRSAYRQSNRMGQNIRWALEDRRKILLTATPLQNSLTELYGLATILDERIFGDLPSFRTQYMNAGGDQEALRERLKAFCKRTLRSHVLEYIQYTERRLITRPFQPTEQEHKLYEAVSDFLKRPDTYALPQRQRHLTALIVRKLLASSSQAVAGTLETMRDRLIAILDKASDEANLAERLIADEEIEDDLLDELLDGGGETAVSTAVDDDVPICAPPAISDSEQSSAIPEQEPPQKIDRQKLAAEIDELNRYIQWARGIGVDTKTRSLLKALEIGFAQMKEIGAETKAVVFTESRRTQRFVLDFLEANGYAGRVATFNGTNKEPATTRIYEKWLEANKGSGRVSGSRPIDVRTAIIEHFRDEASILVATEAAAEGINLQFCSLVVNFDLPWNPQRIEQRIGRCHRYGQKHDVVVINFLNERNEADRRVYELLNEKFSLFSGIFGASDEVLGSIESGVDFERRVLDIYQQCRSPEEIETAFHALRKELDDTIASRIRDTRKALLEHFDEDVHARLKVNLTGAREQLDRVGRMFWALTRFILDQRASFDDADLTFRLADPPIPAACPGLYHLISKERANIPGDFLYRLSHPLGEHVTETGKTVPTPVASVTFDVSHHPARISLVEEIKGKSGWLLLQRLVIDSFEREEHLLFSAFRDDLPAPRPGIFFVYALECDDGSLYIGQTEDIPKRWQEHLDGRAAEWTKRHKPVRIAHYEELGSREEAVKRESDFKTGFGRKWLKDAIASGRARQAGGQALDQETCEKLFNCHGMPGNEMLVPSAAEKRLSAEADRHLNATISRSLERNSRHFNEAREQLEKWAEDMILAAERELRDTKEQIKLLNRQARQATTVQEQHELQERMRELETKKRRLRQRIFDVEDEITAKRDKLIDALERRMQQRTSSERLFAVRWSVV